MSAFQAPQPSPAGFNYDAFLNGMPGMSGGQGQHPGYTMGPTWSLQSPSVQGSVMQDMKGFMPNYNPSWDYLGGGVFQQQNLSGPSAQQMWGGMLHDLQLQDQLNKENWARNQAASDMFLQQSMAAANAAQGAGQAQWDKAAQFQQQGSQQAQKDFERLQGQLKAAQDKMAADKAEVGSIFDKAVSTIGTGADRVASDAAAAIQRRKESDVDQIRAQMGEFTGTEAQIDEAARRRASDYDRDLFGTISNLQYKSEADKAAALQNKGQIFAQLANSTASLGGQFAQMEFGAGESRNKWNEFGANIAMANAKFQADAAQAHAQLTSMNYKSFADMVYRNPVLGVTIAPTLIAMAQAAERYGGGGGRIAPTFQREAPAGSPGPMSSYNYGLGREAFGGMDLQQMLDIASGGPGNQVNRGGTAGFHPYTFSGAR